MKRRPPKLTPPKRGATNAMPYVDTPGDAGPLESMQNIMPRRPTSGRVQVASRPGISDVFDRTFGTIDDAVVVSRASGISGYTVGNATRCMTSKAVAADKIRGQFMLLAEDWSVSDFLSDSRGTGIATPPVGAGGYAGFHTAQHPTDDTICFAAIISQDTTASNQAVIVVGINRIDRSTGTITHQTYALDTDTNHAAASYPTMPATGQGDLFSNELVCNGTYLFLAVRNFIYTFRSDTLERLGRMLVSDAANLVAEEVQSIKPFTLNGTDYLLVLSEGCKDISGPITADGGPSIRTFFGWFSRASVSCYIVQYNGSDRSPVAAGTSSLVWKRLPQGTQNGDAAYEDHGTFRLSEWSLQRPRGCLVWDMEVEVTAESEVFAYIARTNQGFGYDGAVGRRPENVGYVSACCANLTRGFEADAPTYTAPTAAVRYGFDVLQGGWEIDTGSLRRAFSWHATNYLCDIPNSGGDYFKHDPEADPPSLLAVAIDAERSRVFFAGRRPSPNQALPNVYCVRTTDGAILWDTDLAGLVHQNGIGVNPANGNLVVGCARNSDWEGASGAKAELFELDGATGSVVRSFDMGDAVTQNSHIGPWNEKQSITITGTPTGGTFTLTYSGQTTAGIAYNANAAAVQAALEALSNIAPGDVVVTGGPGPGTPWVVEFAGTLAMTNVALMTAVSSLTGGSSPAIAIAITQQGGIVPGAYDVSCNSKGQAIVALAPFRYDT